MAWPAMDGLGCVSIAMLALSQIFFLVAVKRKLAELQSMQAALAHDMALASSWKAHVDDTLRDMKAGIEELRRQVHTGHMDSSRVRSGRQWDDVTSDDDATDEKVASWIEATSRLQRQHSRPERTPSSSVTPSAGGNRYRESSSHVFLPDSSLNSSSHFLRPDGHADDETAKTAWTHAAHGGNNGLAARSSSMILHCSKSGGASRDASADATRLSSRGLFDSSNKSLPLPCVQASVARLGRDKSLPLPRVQATVARPAEAQGLRSPVKMAGAQRQPGKPLPKISGGSRFYGNVVEKRVRAAAAAAAGRAHEREQILRHRSCRR